VSHCAWSVTCGIGVPSLYVSTFRLQGNHIISSILTSGNEHKERGAVVVLEVEVEVEDVLVLVLEVLVLVLEVEVELLEVLLVLELVLVIVKSILVGQETLVEVTLILVEPFGTAEEEYPCPTNTDF
jgi:hypothetical protein